ncbi:MAG: hypothetical protein L3J97_05270 [Thermoplasmata archaeon]|nr:hypothetical protein [Thermoplasmata archaeon]
MKLRRLTIIGLTAVAAAAMVGLYAILTLASTPSSECAGWNGSSCPPNGTALAIGTPINATAHGAHWYNFSVASAAGGLTWGSTHWQLVAATGHVLSPATDWTLQVFGSVGSVVGVYDLVSDVWLFGGSASVTSQMVVSIYSSITSLSGDHAVISGSGSYSGSITVNIP